MFADAIEKIGDFTRPVKIISRKYKENLVVPGLATMFFVNDEGCAVTCKHVAAEIINAEKINKNYREFRAECARTQEGKTRQSAIKKLELTHKLKAGTTAQMKVQFPGSISNFTSFDINMHPDYDIAVIRFKGFERTLYKGHAVFAKSASGVRPGDMLCRLGFPFPEYSDFRYDAAADNIEWDSSAGSANTPRFPIEGMFTRHLAGKDGKVYGIEMSTPGLRGQSGGPLFSADGLIYGMQSATKHLHLGFDMIGEKMVLHGREQTVNNQPFLHVGQCIDCDVICAFLESLGVKYYRA